MSTGNRRNKRRVCLLTGASGRLGTAFASRYAASYDIAGVYATTPPSTPTQEQRFIDPLDVDGWIPENDDAVFGMRADLTDDAEMAQVVKEAVERFGPVDVLINAAVYRQFGLVSDSEDSVVDWAAYQLQVNVVVPLKLCRLLATECWNVSATKNRRANRGVINISSTAGSNVYDPEQIVYASSKAALDHLTRHLAVEFETIGVRVNALAPNSFPGIVSTDEVVDALVSLDNSRSTGAIVSIDADVDGS